VTVLEIIRRSAEYLEKRGVDSPRLQIELLLAHVLKVPRLKLYLDFERTLTEDHLEAVRALVKRRGEREPLQYIVGTTSFCGIELAVNSSVLIPRPETELLVEQAWKFLASRGNRSSAVLDFATGSGCIAVAVAAKFPAAQVHAIDISKAALEVARANAEQNKVDVRFYEGASITAVELPQHFNLILSNPPYIPREEISTLQPEVRDHEPRQALDGGTDGLDFFRMIANEAVGRLLPDARLILELGEGQADAVSALMTSAGWVVESVLPDYSGCPRILIAQR
jgi:release factor glutamine methyltransferase